MAVLSGLRGRVLFTVGRLEDAAPLVAVDADDARANFPGTVPLANALLNLVMLDTARGRYDKARGKPTKHSASSPRRAAVRSRCAIDCSSNRPGCGSRAERRRRPMTRWPTIATPPYAAQQPLRVLEVDRKTLHSEARLQRRVGEAVALAQDAYDQVASSPLRQYYPRLEADAALGLGNALRATGEPARARASLERAVQLRSTYDDVRSPWLARAEAALSACLCALGERQQAGLWRDKAAAIDRAHPDLGPHLVASMSKRPAFSPTF